MAGMRSSSAMELQVTPEVFLPSKAATPTPSFDRQNWALPCPGSQANSLLDIFNEQVERPSMSASESILHYRQFIPPMSASARGGSKLRAPNNVSAKVDCHRRSAGMAGPRPATSMGLVRESGAESLGALRVTASGGKELLLLDVNSPDKDGGNTPRSKSVEPNLKDMQPLQLRKKDGPKKESSKKEAWRDRDRIRAATPIGGEPAKVEMRGAGPLRRALEAKLNALRTNSHQMELLQQRCQKYEQEQLDKAMNVIATNKEKVDEYRKSVQPARWAQRMAERDEREARVQERRAEEELERKKKMVALYYKHDQMKEELRVAEEQKLERDANLRKMQTISVMAALGSRMLQILVTIESARNQRLLVAMQNKSARRIQRWFKKKKVYLKGRREERAAVTIQRHFRKHSNGRQKREEAGAAILCKFLGDVDSMQKVKLCFKQFRAKMLLIQRNMRASVVRFEMQAFSVVVMWNKVEKEIMEKREDTLKKIELTKGKEAAQKAATQHSTRPAAVKAQAVNFTEGLDKPGKPGLPGAKPGAKGPGGKDAPKSGRRQSTMGGEGGDKDWKPGKKESTPAILPYGDPDRVILEDLKIKICLCFQRLKRKGWYKAVAQYLRATHHLRQKKIKEASMTRAKSVIYGKEIDINSLTTQMERPRFRLLATKKEMQLLMQLGVKETFRVREEEVMRRMGDTPITDTRTIEEQMTDMGIVQNTFKLVVPDMVGKKDSSKLGSLGEEDETENRKPRKSVAKKDDHSSSSSRPKLT